MVLRPLRQSEGKHNKNNDASACFSLPLGGSGGCSPGSLLSGLGSRLPVGSLGGPVLDVRGGEGSIGSLDGRVVLVLGVLNE